jgi:hypothetical protein
MQANQRNPNQKGKYPDEAGAEGGRTFITARATLLVLIKPDTRPSQATIDHQT